jgi:hypothetical protein
MSLIRNQIEIGLNIGEVNNLDLREVLLSSGKNNSHKITANSAK